MSDIELLELAAKAAGMRYSANWNPLDEDGDALRLAISIAYVDVSKHILSAWQECDSGHDRCAYVRRAIVRAAAEIGRAMP